MFWGVCANKRADQVNVIVSTYWAVKSMEMWCWDWLRMALDVSTALYRSVLECCSTFHPLFYSLKQLLTSFSTEPTLLLRKLSWGYPMPLQVTFCYQRRRCIHALRSSLMFLLFPNPLYSQIYSLMFVLFSLIMGNQITFCHIFFYVLTALSVHAFSLEC